MFKLTPPENFNFSCPTEWPQWKTRFERFRKATKLDKESGDIQVSTLIYTLGSEVDKIFQTFTFDTPENEGSDPSQSYEIVLDKFEHYFIPRRNIIHERAQFHQTVQNTSESVEHYVRKLFELANHCSFENKDDNIRDQLVIGLRDKVLSRKLQLEHDLTLHKAVSIARTYETVTNQMHHQREQSSTSVSAVNVNALRPGRARPQRNFQSQRGKYNTTFRTQYSTVRGRGQPTRGRGYPPHNKGRIKTCNNCGNSHGYMQCPAYGKQCNFCKNFNHFEKCCRKKSTI